MKVLKFGGSSIASASQVKEVAQLARKGNKHIIVFSALAGMTNRLLDFMRTDKNSEPDPVYIREKLHQLMKAYPDSDLYVTPGYICRNAYGRSNYNISLLIDSKDKKQALQALSDNLFE
jgi:aspartokinase